VRGISVSPDFHGFRSPEARRRRTRYHRITAKKIPLHPAGVAERLLPHQRPSSPSPPPRPPEPPRSAASPRFRTSASLRLCVKFRRPLHASPKRQGGNIIVGRRGGGWDDNEVRRISVQVRQAPRQRPPLSAVAIQ